MSKKIQTLLAAAMLLMAAAMADYAPNWTHSFPLEGVVTLARSSDTYFWVHAFDGTGEWRIDANDWSVAHRGDTVIIKGGRIPERATTKRINFADVEVTGSDFSAIPKPKKVTVDDLYAHPINNPHAEDIYGVLVTCEGFVADINRRDGFTQMQVTDGHRSFQANIHISIDVPLPEELKIGAKVAVTGVALYTPVDDRNKGMVYLNNVSVMPQDIGGVEVVRTAPFWTAAKVWMLLGVALALLAASGVWVLTLRRAVRRQGERLEETIRAKVRDKVEYEAIRRERLRISYELHDNFQQLLAAVQFRLVAVSTWFEYNPEKAKENISKAQEGLLATQQGLRTALWGMNEESDGPKSLGALIGYAVGRMAHWEGKVFVETSGTEPVQARRFALAVLMILQEAVGNALKHGKARRIDVKFVFSKREVAMTVSDDGCGFTGGSGVSPLERTGGSGVSPFGRTGGSGVSPLGAGNNGLGLGSMRRRTEELGGTFSIESEPGRGTVVRVTIPCDGSGKEKAE